MQVHVCVLVMFNLILTPPDMNTWTWRTRRCMARIRAGVFPGDERSVDRVHLP